MGLQNCTPTKSSVIIVALVEGYTVTEAGHRHPYRGYTGPLIPVSGGHIHYIQGTTGIVDDHDHRYGNNSSLQLNA